MNSPLQLGNRALQIGDPQLAIKHYAKATDMSPALWTLLAGNVLVARDRLKRQDDGSGPKVAVYAWDLSENGIRARVLQALYAPFARAEVLGFVWPGDAVPGMPAEAALAIDAERFLEQALSFAAEHPCDIAHFSAPRAPNLLMALINKLLWDARIVIDVDQDELRRVGVKVPRELPVSTELMPPVAALREAPWTQLAVGLMDQFDARTIGDAVLRARMGGTLVAGGDSDALRSMLAELLRKPARSLPSGLMRLLELLPKTPAVNWLRAMAALEPRTAGMQRLAPPASGSTPVRSIAPAAAMASIRPRPQERGVHPVDEKPAWTATAQLKPSIGQALVECLGQAVALRSQDAAETDPQAFIDLAAFHGCPPPATGSPSGRCFRSRWSGAGFALADLWWIDDASLRWRVERLAEGSLTPGCVVRIFQWAAAAGQLTCVAEHLLSGDGPLFFDSALHQPLNPVLIVATTLDGRWLEAGLLPFPSLCRGGAHHAELSMLGSGPNTMASLEDLSATLATELLALPSPLAIATIDVDLTSATGAEKVFAPSVREWLSAVMRIGPARPLPPIGADDASAARRHFEAMCAQTVLHLSTVATERIRQRTAEGALRLTLAADSLPTISALVSRRLGIERDASSAAGAFATAHPVDGRPRAQVWMPPMDDELLAVQPMGRALPFPLLRRAETAAASETASAEGVGLPLAIRYEEPIAWHPAAQLMPIAPDARTTVLRRSLSAADATDATISMLFVPRPGDFDAPQLWASLEQQTLAAALRPVVVLPPPLHPERSGWERSLDARWPGRHQVLCAGETRSSSLLNEGARHATGDTLLLMQPTALLHDPRTLETLLALLRLKRVATASCVVLREVAFKKGTELRFHSGGLFPGDVSFTGRSSLRITEPCTTTAFPCATYPVLGNTFRIALVSTGAWRELNGLDADRFPSDEADVDFCLRAQRSGWRHLCTSALTATDLGGDGRSREHSDTHAVHLLPLQRWYEVLSGCTQLRELGP